MSVTDNVRQLLNEYGSSIKSDKHLLLLYFQKIDHVKMDKESISTKEFLEKASDIGDILRAKMWIEVTEEGEKDRF